MLTPEICEAVLRDHFRKPRHSGVCEGGTFGKTENPLCGDQIHLSVKLDESENRLVCVRFEGSGCAASQAGASLILSRIQGMTRLETETFLTRFCALIESGNADPEAYFEEFEETASLLVFSKIPARTQCATLAARLLMDMLKQTGP